MLIYPYINKLKKKDITHIKYKEISFKNVIGSSCSFVYKCKHNNKYLCAKEFISDDYYDIDTMFELLTYEIDSSYLVRNCKYGVDLYGVTYKVTNNVLYFYIIYEFIKDSTTLYNYLNDYNNWIITDTLEFKLEDYKKKSLILQLIDGINEFHEKGIIHCDIKTDNILFINSKIKIIDYGSACIMNEGQLYYDNSKWDTYIGTEGYMAPELYDNYIYYQSDIYSLGVCICEIILGELLYDGLDTYDKCRSHIFDNLIKIKNENYKTIIKKCIDEDYTKRPSLKEIKEFILSM